MDTHHNVAQTEAQESPVVPRSAKPVNCVSPLAESPPNSPPPLPPRTHTPQGKDHSETHPVKSPPPPASPDIIITHL